MQDTKTLQMIKAKHQKSYSRIILKLAKTIITHAIVIIEMGQYMVQSNSI